MHHTSPRTSTNKPARSLPLPCSPGRWLFQWLGDLVTTFLDCVSAGSSFVFGASYRDHFFAFSVLPTLCYFSAFVAIMYYLGVMGFVIKTVAGLLQVRTQRTPQRLSCLDTRMCHCNLLSSTRMPVQVLRQCTRNL